MTVGRRARPTRRHRGPNARRDGTRRPMVVAPRRALRHAPRARCAAEAEILCRRVARGSRPPPRARASVGGGACTGSCGGRAQSAGECTSLPITSPLRRPPSPPRLLWRWVCLSSVRWDGFVSVVHCLVAVAGCAELLRWACCFTQGRGCAAPALRTPLSKRRSHAAEARHVRCRRPGC